MIDKIHKNDSNVFKSKNYNYKYQLTQFNNRKMQIERNRFPKEIRVRVYQTLHAPRKRRSNEMTATHMQ